LLKELTVEPIRSERDGRLGIITIARPERHNSLDIHTAQELRKSGLQMARDPRIGAVLLLGSDGIFCSGVDLKYVRGGGHPCDVHYLRPNATDGATDFGAIFKQTLEYLNSTISEIRRAAKPFIAGVDGVAAAGGLGIALCCDLVIASERSTFEWAYGKTGLSGAESTTFFLPRLVGLRRALDIALLSPRLDARQALRMNLISEVLPTDEFELAVRALGRRLADGPTKSYGRIKMLLNRATGGEWLEEHLDEEVSALVSSANGEEFAEGLGRFFAERGAREPER
jgi:2-(1,2-epoxy-1,2-dihydrophenyl)acetyl-CoA isomerase